MTAALPQNGSTPLAGVIGTGVAEAERTDATEKRRMEQPPPCLASRDERPGGPPSPTSSVKISPRDENRAFKATVADIGYRRNFIDHRRYGHWSPPHYSVADANSTRRRSCAKPTARCALPGRVSPAAPRSPTSPLARTSIETRGFTAAGRSTWNSSSALTAENGVALARIYSPEDSRTVASTDSTAAILTVTQKPLRHNKFRLTDAMLGQCPLPARDHNLI